MVELTIEEKAKAYDEAIEKGKQILNTPYTAHWDLMKEVVEHILPELRESEDEKIREALLDYFKWNPNGQLLNEFSNKEVFAWLEKQGEQKPAGNSGKKSEDVIEEKDMTEYKKGFECGKQCVLKYPEDYNLCKKIAWSEEDEAIYYGVIETEQYMLDVVNGIKKFDVGNASIKEDCTRELNWLKNIKDRLLPQLKQEWSEEDERFREYCINAINGIHYYSPENKQELVGWLKFLRPQSQWKPSDEQMELIKDIVFKDRQKITRKELAIFHSIYNDLKKLKD